MLRFLIFFLALICVLVSCDSSRRGGQGNAAVILRSSIALYCWEVEDGSIYSSSEDVVEFLNKIEFFSLLEQNNIQIDDLYINNQRAIIGKEDSFLASSSMRIDNQLFYLIASRDGKGVVSAEICGTKIQPPEGCIECFFD